jgi:ankyrin repeat protein
MTIKLITSKSYVDNLRDFLPEKPNCKTSDSEKLNKHFNRIINSPNFIYDRNDKKIADYITTLITIRPGRTLFKRLLKTDKLLQIVFDSKSESEFRYFGELIPIITLNDSKVTYGISANSAGEKMFISESGFIALAHELIHALHYFEERQEFIEKSNNKNILNPDLDDLEEEETIIGKEGEGTLCENLFRFRFGYPLRLNHIKLELNKESTFTLSDCAANGTLANLKELLLVNPSLLNLSQWRAGSQITGYMTPLNAALWADQAEILEYLFQVGVDVNAEDEYWGTPLHTSALTNPDWITFLLKKGADPDVKESKGLTALELALFKKQYKAAEILAPLTNINGLDKYGYSILHRSLEILSPEGIWTLIQYGADINCQDWDGNTPLMHCCNLDYTVDNKKEFQQKFKILLENDDIELNAKNINGESALSLAVQKKHFWQVDALVKNGAELPLNLKKTVKKQIKLYNKGIEEELDGPYRGRCIQC